MTVATPPAYIQASSHPADVFRRAILMMAHGQQGVRDYVSGDLVVSANGTPNMSVNVAAGQCAILNTQNTTYGGLYSGALNDASVNLSIAAADPTNPRIDLVVAQVRDAAYSGANNDWILAVITGTPAASPSPPATPANAIVLAQVSVAANATSITSGNITDKRPIFGSLFHAEAYQASAQIVSNAAWTVVAFDTIESDPNGNFTTGLSAHYTCPVGGRYRVDSTVMWLTPGALVNPISIEAFKNGALAKRGWQGEVPSGTVTPTLTLSAVVRANSGDTLDVRVYQAAGTNYNTLQGQDTVWVAFTFLGP